jgi:GAF domain-containing protein
LPYDRPAGSRPPVSQQQRGDVVVRVTRQLAERIADLAKLMLDDESSDASLRQLTELALELIPGSTAAGVVTASGKSWSYAASSGNIADLHRAQMRSGDGPVAEAIRHGEARRIDDAGREQRWPAACAAMTEHGFRSCLALPLRTDSKPGGALVVYGPQADGFAGSGQDLALLFAAQGGVALRNASAYRSCRQLVVNLQSALESRAVIEQAKGILVAEYGFPPETAFKQLSALSQNTNRKVRDIAADLVDGRVDRTHFNPAAD